SPSGMGGAGAHEVWVLDNFEQDPFAKCAMIDTAENVAAEFDVTRSELDDVVLRRYEQYQDALSKDSAFQKRFMAAPLELTNKKGRVTARAEGDEGIRPVTREGLEALKPVRPEGVVTYGGQTHPADGAAGLIVTNAEMADEFSQDTNIAIRVVSFGQHRERVGYMPAAPIGASQKALDAAGLKIEQISAIKSHNPFAVNDVAFARAFDLDVMTMNNYGCSLIWGHPQGPTGLRAIIELIEELVLLGGGYGLFQGCAAGDSAMAVIIRVG
ncbi:MAG: thiolase family protein, partial [Pseudomonadota bacterium]